MGQRYEELVQEDLNVGTSAVWVTAPSGGELRSTQIGLHSFARGQKEWTAAWTPGSIAAGSKASTTVTVTDAAVADFVLASHDKMLTNALRIAGHVSAAHTAKVVIHNPTTAAITVAAGTVSVLVFPVIAETPVPPIITSISGTITCADLGGSPLVGSIMKLYLFDGASFVLYDTQASGVDGSYGFTGIVPPYTEDGKYLWYINYSLAGGSPPTANTGQSWYDDGEAVTGVDIGATCSL